MCSTAFSATFSSSCISSATRVRPSSRAGGTLQTCAVMMFCRFVLFLLCRLLRIASQILLTLDLAERSAGAAAGASADVSRDLVMRFVSLYMV
ncbi:hypothetical protein CH063_10426 [Colletotrichum higginsianum]|uniref:Uncharacterized protein n=1 Tax=Colletotrichum higginsianum (strain IMI 349063) TaxID=759273 RepID=H1VHE9_COLHI|nr:hypothetical protein CH063_10426 [Colletotrichum higginsianum]